MGSRDAINAFLCKENAKNKCNYKTFFIIMGKDVSYLQFIFCHVFSFLLMGILSRLSKGKSFEDNLLSG